MLYIKIFILIVLQFREHRSVSHVMTVDDGIHAKGRHRASLVDKKHPALGLLLVKAVGKVKVICGIHDGVIDFRTIYSNPAYHVRVLLVKLPILFQHDLLLR